MTRPVLDGGRVQLATLLPDNSPCGGGRSFLMALAAGNGGRLGASLFDINNDGADRTDTGEMLSGVGSEIGILTRPTLVLQDRDRQAALLSGTPGKARDAERQRGPDFDLGRRSWQELR